MSSAELLEKELRLRDSDWWNRLCDVIPELQEMSGTPALGCLAA